MDGRTSAAILPLSLLFTAIFTSGCGQDTVPAASELMTEPYSRPDFSNITIGYPEAIHFQMTTGSGLDQHCMVQESEKVEPTKPLLL